MRVHKYNRLLVILGLGAVITGCNNGINPDYDIYDYNWVDTTGSETEVIYFGSDNHFSYYEVSGSPVGDYDLCESYKIKEDTIKLKCSEKGIVNKFRIVSVDDEFLKLEIDGKTKIFVKEREEEIEDI